MSSSMIVGKERQEQDKASRPGRSNEMDRFDFELLKSQSPEKQGLQLLTWIGGVEQAGSIVNEEEIVSDLLQICSLTAPFPTRAIRDLIAASFVKLYTNDGKSGPFELVNKLLSIVNAGKNECDIRNWQ